MQHFWKAFKENSLVHVHPKSWPSQWGILYKVQMVVAGYIKAFPNFGENPGRTGWYRACKPEQARSTMYDCKAPPSQLTRFESILAWKLPLQFCGSIHGWYLKFYDLECSPKQAYSETCWKPLSVVYFLESVVRNALFGCNHIILFCD